MGIRECVALRGASTGNGAQFQHGQSAGASIAVIERRVVRFIGSIAIGVWFWGCVAALVTSSVAGRGVHSSMPVDLHLSDWRNPLTVLAVHNPSLKQ